MADSALLFILRLLVTVAFCSAFTYQDVLEKKVSGKLFLAAWITSSLLLVLTPFTPFDLVGISIAFFCIFVFSKHLKNISQGDWYFLATVALLFPYPLYNIRILTVPLPLAIYVYAAALGLYALGALVYKLEGFNPTKNKGLAFGPFLALALIAGVFLAILSNLIGG